MRLSRKGEALVREAMDSILKGEGMALDLSRNPEADEIRKILQLRLQRRLLGHARKVRHVETDSNKSV